MKIKEINIFSWEEDLENFEPCEDDFCIELEVELLYSNDSTDVFGLLVGTPLGFSTYFENFMQLDSTPSIYFEKGILLQKNYNFNEITIYINNYIKQCQSETRGEFLFKIMENFNSDEYVYDTNTWNYLNGDQRARSIDS